MKLMCTRPSAPLRWLTISAMALVQAPPLVPDQAQVVGIDLRHQHGHVRGPAMRRIGRDDDDLGARIALLQGGGGRLDLSFRFEEVICRKPVHGFNFKEFLGAGSQGKGQQQQVFEYIFHLDRF